MKRHITVLLCVSLLNAVPALAIAKECTIENDVSELMSRADIPGLGFAELSGTRIDFDVYGYANAGKHRATKDTIFEAASLTKPVVAYLVMRLIERKVLKLDDALVDLLPSLPLPKDDPRSKQVTVRMALAHMSGLDGPDNQTLTFAENPGTKFRYYPAGYRLVQRIVEHLEKSDLETIAKREVFEPLGMNSSSLIYRQDFSDRLATRHNLLSEPIDKFRDPNRRANAAASLMTTTGDYACFLKEMINPSKISEKSVRTMLEPQIEIDETNGAVAWGVGWGLEPERGTFFHWGDDGSAKCFTIGSRSNDKAILYFTNSFNGMCIAGEMAKRVLPGESPAVEWLNYHNWDSPFRTARKEILQTFISAGPEAGMSKFEECQQRYKDDLDMAKIARWMTWLLDTRALHAERIAMLNWQIERDAENIDLYLNLIRSIQAAGGDSGQQKELARKLMPLAIEQDDVVTLNNIAWYFAVNPGSDGSYLQTEETVELARKACKLAPESGNWKNTLGVALYRDGKWKESIEVLEKSNQQGFDVVYNWVFIAMNHWKQGNEAESKKWYDKSIAWKKENASAVSRDSELRSFFAEAEKLMRKEM